MALTKPRNPNFFRTWLRDPNGVATNSQSWVLQHLPLLRAQDFVLPQADWPVPYTAANQEPRSISLLTWTWSYNLNLVGKDRLPFRQSDWPVPKGPQRAIDLLTWIDVHVRFGKDALPFNQQDWPPVPKGWPPRQDYQQAVRIGLIGKDTLPFRQSDWPVPKTRLPVALTHIDIHVRYAGQDTLPFNQDDWPNPKGQPPRQDWVVSSSISLTTVTQAPFNQEDWPVPRGPKPALQDWQDRTKTLLIGQDSLPARVGDWGLPDGPKPRLDWVFPSRVALTTATQSPFTQTDWPVPKGQLPRHQDWIDRSKILLIGQDRLPASLIVADAPIGKPPSLQDWIFPTTIALTVVPFAQRDWPNPKGHPPRQDWQQALNLSLNVTPFRQLDWPVPKGQPPRQDWQDRTRILLIGQDVLPFRQSVVRMSVSSSPHVESTPGCGGTITVGTSRSSARRQACRGPAPPNATSENARGSWPRPTETARTARAMLLSTTSTMPAAASSSASFNGRAILASMAARAAFTSIGISPPRSASGMRPRTRCASVTVGSVPPRP
jgi:hypothetical protein